MTPRRHSLRRAQVTLVAFLTFAGLAPSALAATAESEDTPATRTAVADASVAREPTRAGASVLDVASDAAERVSTALEASETSFDSSADGGAHARGERSDDSASAGNEDGKSSVGRAVDQGRSDVRDQTRAVGEKAATP